MGESNILKEVLRLERQSMLVRVQGSSYGQLMHTMRKQIDEQDKIMAQNRNDILNLNAVESVFLSCAVTICLSGIMFDSPFLSDGSVPLRGMVLGYVSIVVILFSLIYFAVAFLWEVKMSQKKKKTKRQVMWSKLRGMKHVVVEDSRQQAKKSMLQSIMEKNKTKKVQPFNLKKLTTIVPSANSLALADNAPTTFENNASVVED